MEVENFNFDDMSVHLDKTPEDKHQVTTDKLVQTKSTQESISPIQDNRPETLQLKQMQDLMNSSPQVKQLQSFQAKANNHAAQQSLPIQKKENNTGLPDQLKSGIEGLSGHSMDDVKVHYNSSKPAQLQAHAYAQGSNIHIAPGQEKHLPHEAWHVVQQKQNRVQATKQLKGKVNINDDKGLEKEADVMGLQAMKLGSTGLTPQPMAQLKSAGSGNTGAVAQCAIMHSAPNFHPKNGRAGSVSVENIHGTPYGAGANQPSTGVFGWPQLIASGDTLGNPHSTHYNAVRMHLWNGRLGGPGGNPANLAPGPAQINSSMSAGPETASKDAVASGEWIWLETEVWYQNNSGNANDFTSVVPNRMRMQWGNMLDKNGSKAGYLNPATHRGPALAPAWDHTIDQPAGALTAAQQKNYTDLNALAPAAQTPALNALVAGVSNQEKAQAFALVNPNLQKHLLLNHASIYTGMDDTARAGILNVLSAAEIQTLITTLGIADHKILYNEILVEMFATPVKLQTLFQTFPLAEQKNLLKYSDGDLFTPLGDIARNIAKTDKSIFNLLSRPGQAHLLDHMSKAEIATLLHDRMDKKLFKNWAKMHHKKTPVAMEKFISTKVNYTMAHGFRKAMEWEKKRNDPRLNTRPSRAGGVKLHYSK